MCGSQGFENEETLSRIVDGNCIYPDHFSATSNSRSSRSGQNNRTRCRRLRTRVMTSVVGAMRPSLRISSIAHAWLWSVAGRASKHDPEKSIPVSSRYNWKRLRGDHAQQQDRADDDSQKVHHALARVDVRTPRGIGQQQPACVGVSSLMHHGMLGRGVKVAHPPLQRRGII
jgi:hypothetical protein